MEFTCEGSDRLPTLIWVNAPENTKSFALIVDDPDAVKVVGKIWVHLVAWNILPTVRKLTDLSDVVVGKNSWDENNYRGPCPPKGVHNYHFKLYALDTMLNLDTSNKKRDVELKMKGHVLATTTLVGKYEIKKT